MFVITYILFGDCSNAPKVLYINPSGRELMVSLEEAYMNIETDCDAAFKTVAN